jgi:molybdopterin-guanine dinucleotide biosynthesis protein B
MHELGDEPEARFETLLAETGPCDLVLVEGFKNEIFPKIEIRRDGAVSREPLAPQIPQVVALASDRPLQEMDGLPVFHIDDAAGIADFVIAHLNLASFP